MNNCESKVTSRTLFELLHGYRPRYRLGALRALTLTSNEWVAPEELRRGGRELIEESKLKVKEAYDRHRHDHTHYSLGEIVVMKNAPEHTGESTKLQDRYRGSFVVSEVLPSDVYRVVELNNSKRSHFATTAHVSQLKSWKLFAEGDEKNRWKKRMMTQEKENQGKN